MAKHDGCTPHERHDRSCAVCPRARQCSRLRVAHENAATLDPGGPGSSLGRSASGGICQFGVASVSACLAGGRRALGRSAIRRGSRGIAEQRSLGQSLKRPSPASMREATSPRCAGRGVSRSQLRRAPSGPAPFLSPPRGNSGVAESGAKWSKQSRRRATWSS